MGLLFNRSDDSDSGCTGHHFENYTIDWSRSSISKEFRNSSGEEILEVQVVKTATCEHEGCYKTGRRNGGILQIPIDAVCLPSEDIEGLAEHIEAFFEDKDEEE